MFWSLLRPLPECHTRIQTTQTTVQNAQVKPPDVTVNNLSVPFGHKVLNYIVVKSR